MSGPRPRVVIVGEDFGNSDPRYHKDLYALTGASGARLADLAGISTVRFYVATERTNVVATPDRWRDLEAVAAGVRRITGMIVGRRVILLGSKVAAAFQCADMGYFSWEERLNAFVARVPHPSGRNRLLNEEEVRVQFSRFLKETFR